MKKSSFSFVPSSMSRQKQRKVEVARTAGAVLCVLLVGLIITTRKYSNELKSRVGSELEQWLSWHPSQEGNWLGQSLGWVQLQNQSREENPKSTVIPLVSIPATARSSRLEAIAQQPKSQDSLRARYLLASDLIGLHQGKKAIRVLEGLDRDYPVLAPYVVLKRAQSYEMIGDKAKAIVAWKDLLKRSTLWYKNYPDNPVAAEALFVLGRTNPKYWDEAIAQFPSHPRTLQIVRERLKQNPNQPQLLLLLAKYAYDQPGIIKVLDQLVKQRHLIKLTPEDWEVIGFDYWESRDYDKAATAYANAPLNPRNAYRIARGRQLSSQTIQAAAAYIRMVSKYPRAKETGNALLQLAKIEQNPEDALSYTDLLISRFPDRAGEALLKRAKIVESLDNPSSAAEARQLLLNQHGDSSAAAEYRWNMALARAAVKDYQGACTWASPISTHNPKSILAPRATFWFGKWSKRLGRQREAKAAFEYVLTNYPQSYYAWRSAAILGLKVGDFTTVRQLTPQVVMPMGRPMLTAGSATLKELYQLGQDQDAWKLWQAEFTNKMQPTVAEQFTDGLIRLGRGENLVGISKVSSLEDRETPKEQAEFQDLKQQMPYWQALYPFPFLQEIKTWSQQRQLNPLLVVGLTRQESRFQPKIRSVAGATGLMQVMPESGKWVAEQLNLKKYSLLNPNDNVRLGTWLLDQTHRQYKNNSLLAVASYNAGSGNVSKWLKKLDKSDPDEFVEAIPFDETKDYVRQVFGNYWNYLRLYNPKISQLVAKYSAKQPKLQAQ